MTGCGYHQVLQWEVISSTKTELLPKSEVYIYEFAAPHTRILSG